MAFDDYSYKFFNNVVLNPKTIKAINDDENTSLVAATDIRGMGDMESVLTSDNVMKFERTNHFDEDGAVNEFVQKDLRGSYDSSQTQNLKSEEKKKEDDWDTHENDKRHKKKRHEDSDNDSNEDSEPIDEDESERFDLLEKTKITKSMVDGLKNL